MKRKKIERSSGIKQKIVYRDAFGRFAKREDSASEETWSYRTSKKTPSKILDLKIDALPFREENTEWYRSIKISDSGSRAGKISAALKKTIRQIGISRHDSRIEITMTAKTYHGKIVKRKLSFYHYNSIKLEEHTIGGIINNLFYEHGDRPAYPVNIVKGWRKRETTKKETMKRRQLYNVTFNIKTEVETRKQGEMKKRRKNKK